MTYDFPTLPDLLRPGMDLLFIGINPSLYSVERGHYFARRTSRFWPGFSRSRLSEPVRRALGLDVLEPEHDRDLLRFGMGFTDVVKVPSSNASAVTPAMYAEWTPRLFERLAEARPRLAVFHGVTGYRPFLRHALGVERKAVDLGMQLETLGETRLFLVPNPSAANAHFTLEDQVGWYDRVADVLQTLHEKAGR